MLPAKFRYELSAYELQINSCCIKARVLTEADMLEVGIADLRSRLGKFPVVGFDFRTDFEIDVERRRSGTNPYETLVLYAEHCCVIIQLELMRCSSNLTHLWRFLGDTNICFVGVEMNTKINKLGVWKKDFANNPKPPITILETATDIKDFFDTALCYSKLRSRPLYQASGIEANLQELTGPSESTLFLDWGNLTPYSSAEDIKSAMHEAFSCHRIANMILQDTLPVGKCLGKC